MSVLVVPLVTLVRFLCKSFVPQAGGLEVQSRHYHTGGCSATGILGACAVAEVQEECPIPEEDLKKSVIDVLENREMNLELLLQGAIFEKLAELMKVHAAGAITRVLHGPPNGCSCP